MVHILVIEDEYAISQVLNVYLKKVGYVVTQDRLTKKPMDQWEV
ncbi:MULTISPECIES: response regulator transcription factor [Lysinibacillus]|uniref:Response regulatory domain-containing protein n=3 Tax=Lysinibacillus TaxID=400634 RepID=W7RLJ5_LYSSH|nr:MULTISPECIES: response regulator transcription factor [Lysinibacillus]ACA42116.1 hypothetical protein Bsph_4672 [Lysinibacillus sphaericus C3-41]EWH31389.1 hypothetical protein P799_19765 [Lysinibacillus sphaericus CBAM5]EWH31651.1 hypothetical protein P799_18700 [Lysinibacillus sphaericus CBAM5]MCS1396534.1 response regulator transcription factor [Lysinibacillus sp. PB211]MDR0160981.1 response regulator transcription factor [Lysinibacillus sphaericus]